MEQNLPAELVSNILSRLPSKDLMTCKRVCKSWFDLITDPHFVTNHYDVYNNLQSQEEHLLVIGRPFLFGLKTHISVVSYNMNDPKKQVSSALLCLPDEYNSDHKYWSEISGPCNGIYFLGGNPNVMMNPSLGQFKSLPESHFTVSFGTYSLAEYFGFGFDPKTNNYKVVMVKDQWLKETDERKLGYWTAELYSLNSNSWRKLDDALPLPIEIWGSSRVYTYVNNCCHWWGYVDESGRTEDVVLAFDMVNETFRKIKVPRIRCSSEEEFATLAPFNESATIGVIVYPVKGTEKRFDVWVMKDYWDEGSWVKQYSVGPVAMTGRLVGFIGGNRFIWKNSNERLVLHESETSNETKDLNVYGKCDSLRAATYKESLVSLHRGNEFSS
ncbi:F-box/kelch-repeat protein At3g06240-like [Abrus precatorius]|uniref:F-box/kelch-repeat protein At3g06240-like n=1 Tax=Abrus precatorius TaxID=3816 RepID=A0A8B8LRM4_ABRPR|nr:F-box/kelch-repeat protein At3g06240-like [Abrus precatorius]